ncbi:hypothetical protein GZ77_00965 [Endozoicomonas montiporae]|uniref:DUF1302 domain-containing protein n=3 Tax=Endozoicomonas montiporae TaxID=1027273 RepID=A0A081NA01_9GAMM|nr:DUF1302 domain-containing protein [Endozoicomonas montiporae]AMO57057.1 hypothetical protein EZMO1_3022 [Endozoicomonas montiporae CL-33]KEQ15274.1 hypothetical protein GZ77_00965 [Endozoicomonas montiporae]
MMPGRLPALRIAPAQVGFSLVGLLLAFPSYSLEFSDDSGSITGALDTTLSYGTMWRVQGQDLKHYDGSSTADHDDVNTNDGNRAYDTGLVSQIFRVSADLEVDWEDQYGLFIRGTAFYDTQMMDRSNNWLKANQGRSPDQTNTYPYGDDWSKDVLDGQGHDAKIQDAYVYGAWDVGEMPLDVRFGKQVINWGEGIFYRDGINTVNALDGASFALPGSEVKDLLIPQNALSFRLGITDNLSMAAYYQFEWENSVTPGRGTFFSTNDLFTDGGTKGYNQIPDSLNRISGIYGLANARSLYGDMAINTHGDYIIAADTSTEKDASDNGQWGINFKYYAEEMNDTEFGFYFVNYNSHVPFIQAQLDQSVVQRSLDLASANAANLSAALGELVPDSGGATLQDLLIAANPDKPLCTDTPSCNRYIQGVAASAHVISNGMSATRVYPEDIRMYGISFNTAVGNTSIGGELAYRPNAPMWIDHPDDLIDGVNDNMPNILGSVRSPALECFTDLSQANQDRQYCLSSGPYQNYKEVKLWTGSLVFIRNFGPSFGFDGLYGILEPSFELIQGLDDYDKYVSTASGPYGKGFADDYHPASDRLDKLSWGYTAVLSGELNDVIAGINFNPVLTFKHDVEGNSRLTGNFLEDRKAVTVALRAIYLNTVEAGLVYTTFFGSERTNALHDRDNVAFNVKYSF